MFDLDRPFRGAPPLDAVVVGGGPAGLSAALVLGRARRSVLLLDTGSPANAVSQGVGGLLAHDRREAHRAAPRRSRPAPRPSRTSTSASPRSPAPSVPATRSSSRSTTGPPVRDHASSRPRPALRPARAARHRPLWGTSVFHCAFCDGWEVRDRPLAFHGSGPAAARSALVLASWSNDVLLCTDGPARLAPSARRSRAAGVRIREEPISRLSGRDGQLERDRVRKGPPSAARRSSSTRAATSPTTSPRSSAVS